MVTVCLPGKRGLDQNLAQENRKGVLRVGGVDNDHSAALEDLPQVHREGRTKTVRERTGALS